MAKANVASAQEVLASQAFLRALGADWHNVDLIHGVVAWFRQESGSLSRVLGNNPFNIRNDPSAIGYRQTLHNGHFAIFKTLEEGFAAAARLLLSAGDDWRGYGLIVRAAKTGRVVDFLTAIAMSAWDAAHYGYPATNNLIKTYNSITGLTIPATGPDGRPIQPRPRHPHPRPITPRTPGPPSQDRGYLDPLEAGRFYRQRSHKVDPL